MAHVAHLKFTIGAFEYRLGAEAGETQTQTQASSLYTIPRTSITKFHSSHERFHQEHAEQGNNTRVRLSVLDMTEPLELEMTEKQFTEFQRWYRGEMNFVGEVMALPLQLVEDPIRYLKPFTGTSDKGVPYYEFHNPNGKSAIRISLDKVDITRFDSHNDDTHDFVIITKARVLIRCQCTVAEQQGLEYAIRGIHKRTAAAESNVQRRLVAGEAS